MAGDARRSDTLVTGDAVNTAKRLESSAGPGEILIGEETYRLVRGVIRAEALPPLAVKGKERPLRAYRLLEVAPGVRTRPQQFGSTFVGRQRELVLLRDAWRHVARERSCHLVTVLGEPGIGKSRLVGEVVREVGPTGTVLRGSCLAYGEGITFWPVIEIVRDAAHAEDGDGRRGRPGDARLACWAGDEHAAGSSRGLSELIGAAGGPRRARGAVLGRSASSSRRSPAGGRSSSSSTTSTGARRRSGPHRARRRLVARCADACSSASPGPSCSRSARLGRRQAQRDRDPPRTAQRARSGV